MRPKAVLENDSSSGMLMNKIDCKYECFRSISSKTSNLSSCDVSREWFECLYCALLADLRDAFSHRQNVDISCFMGKPTISLDSRHNLLKRRHEFAGKIPEL